METKSQELSRRSFCKCSATAALSSVVFLTMAKPATAKQDDAEEGRVPGHAEGYSAMRRLQTVSAAERLQIG